MTVKTQTPAKAFAQVQKSAEAIRNDQTQAVGTVSPGDVIRQGDLYLVALGVNNATGDLTPTSDRQLAPGTSQGSRHVIQGAAKVYRAANPDLVAGLVNRLVKGAAVEPDLVGPVVQTVGPCTVTHPEHGDFDLPAGETFAVVYQRAWADQVRRQLD